MKSVFHQRKCSILKMFGFLSSEYFDYQHKNNYLPFLKDEFFSSAENYLALLQKKNIYIVYGI